MTANQLTQMRHDNIIKQMRHLYNARVIYIYSNIIRLHIVSKVMIRIQNFINGDFHDADSYIDSFSPATGHVYAKVPDSTAEDVERAVQAAKFAFPRWAEFTVTQRSNIMLKIADLIHESRDELAVAESNDQGKPVWLSKSLDIPRAEMNFRFFATAVLHRLSTSSQLPETNALNYTVHAPAGVVGQITPWNLPLYLLTFKIAPAIAAGCCVVAKPSEMTSVTAWMLCSIFQKAGLPPGVVNIVFGTGKTTGSVIVDHPDVKLLSFTGSTLVGRYIQERSAKYLKKLSLELGGKNAGVIFEDADLDKAVATCVRSSFINQGEICLCTSRLFVQESIFDKFCDEFVKATRSFKVGPPECEDTRVGALVSKEHLEKVKFYIAQAIKDGGKILCGETVDEPLELPEENKKGYFLHPTVITGLHDSSRCMQEEIFGPVVCISSFKDETEVIDRVNNVEYGLSASIWSRDVSKIHRIAPKLEVGTVWCNCWLVRDLRMPFGGMKMSGIGRESQHDSLEFYSEVKTICVQY